MTKTLTPKVLVIGGGPGGYVAAIRCGQLGLDTALVEHDRLGGTCLIRGCIPSKALIHAADKFDVMAQSVGSSNDGISLTEAPQLDFARLLGWKDSVIDQLNGGVSSLLRGAGVTVVHGWGRFSDAKTCHVDGDAQVVIKPEHVVLATGSQPVELTDLPFGDKVLSSTELLSLERRPDTLAVVGGGYIGLELGEAFAKLGTKVTIIEAGNALLPQYDRKTVAPVARALTEKGVKVLLETKALELTPKGLVVQPEGKRKSTLRTEKILVAVGRRPLTAGWGLSQMPVKMSGPYISVDETCATSCKNVWAIGDLVGNPMLAHKASAQGKMVAEVIAGKRKRFAPVAIPEICFTDPEIVSVGNTTPHEDTVQSAFPLAANGRTLSMGKGGENGFIRVTADRGSHRILGITAVGHAVSELSAAFTQAIELGAVLEDIADIIYAHPTVGEGFHEAALKTMGAALHV